MKLKKMVALSLAAALSIGMVAGVNAAELDTAWYAANNPDVVAEVGDSQEALQLHYDMYGRKEARMANEHDTEAKLRKLFNAEEYAALYPDVQAVFGDDAEAMFQHYISYGLLEARRPSDKVSYEAAVALRTAVVTAMEKAGIVVTPGCVEIVAVIEGNTAAIAVSAEAVEVLAQVTAEVEAVVTATVEEATEPASSSSSSGSDSGCSSDGYTYDPGHTHTPTTVTGNDVSSGEIWKKLVCSECGEDLSE